MLLFFYVFWTLQFYKILYKKWHVGIGFPSGTYLMSFSILYTFKEDPRKPLINKGFFCKMELFLVKKVPNGFSRGAFRQSKLPFV